MAPFSVSVVIPAYNAERYIRNTLDSVLSQTYPIAEVIVVDDGSRDGTCAIVESYGLPVRLLRQQNAGPSTARNLGSAQATSTHIAYVDADDAWVPEKIARQMALLEATPGAVLCYTGLLNFNEEEGTSQATLPAPLASLRSELRLRNPQVVPSSVVVVREAFERMGGFDPGLKGSEDWDFALAMLEVGPFCKLDEPLTLYRVSTTSLSASPDHMYREAHKMLDRRLLSGMRGPSRFVWRHRVLSYHAYTAALNARAGGDPERERHYMIQSLLHWPSPFWHASRFKAAAVTLRNTFVRPVPVPQR